jgi:hypothetical protein
MASDGVFDAPDGGAAFYAYTHHAPAKKVPEISSRKKMRWIATRLSRTVGNDN